MMTRYSAGFVVTRMAEQFHFERKRTRAITAVTLMALASTPGDAVLHWQSVSDPATAK